MDDREIIELYFQRDHRALTESQGKYGAACRRVADNILRDSRDSEECVNDTWLTAWGIIPPQKPNFLGAFFAKITRNIAVSRLRKRTADKRKGDDCAVCIDELAECIPDRRGEKITEDMELRDALNRFLGELTDDARKIFLRRYWFVCSVKEIAGEMSMKEGAVKMSLSRTRSRLREFLEKEGIDV